MSLGAMSGNGSGKAESSFESLSVKLEIFEGPLDLLLHLIRESKVDITDIPIASITEQYLQYIELMKSLDLDVAGEFLVMAATLMHIKSRLLLPVDEEEGGEEEGEDPRLELVRQLQEYQKYKEAGMLLRELEEQRSRVFARGTVGPEGPKRTDYPLEVSLFELLGALKRIMETAPEESPVAIRKDHFTVAERITEVLDFLSGVRGEVTFEDLFQGSRTLSDVIVTFLALLELVRLHMIRAWQAVPGGRIMVSDIRPEAEPGEEEPPAGPRDAGGEADTGEEFMASPEETQGEE